MPKTKRTKQRQIRHDHLTNMRKRRKSETVNDPPNTISAQFSFSESEPQSPLFLSESESDSTDSAFKPDKEALVRTMFDFYDALIEDKKHNGKVSCGTKVRVVCNGKVVDRRGHLKSNWQESLIKSKTCANDKVSSGQVGGQDTVVAQTPDECDVLTTNTNEDVYHDGPKVRVLCNGKVISRRRHLKKNWNRSRKSRVHGKESLSETVLSGTLPRGRNGGMRPVVHVVPERQRNRSMNMDRVNSNRQQTRERQRLKREQVVRAQIVLETALKKSSLSQRVAHVYDVQQGERMVCLAG